MFRATIVVGLVALRVGTRRESAQDGPRVVKMAVSAAPGSEVTVPYFLLPNLREMKPGNASLFYMRSQTHGLWSYRRKDVAAAIDTLEHPWSPEVAKKLLWLETYGALQEADAAARLESCDWQLLERLRTDGLWLQVEEFQSMRTIGALNAARVRSAIHQGEFDKAARGLQTGFAEAKHVGDAPLLVAYIVGITLSSMNQDNLEEWIQQPGAPSLFWVLADLPQPLIDWRRSLESEAIMIDHMMPEIRRSLQEQKPTPIPVQTLQKYVEKLQGERLKPVLSAFSMALVEPEARAYFLAKGLAADDIDRLPVTQLVLMSVMAHYDLRSNEWRSIQNLPYWQARPFLKRLRESEERAAQESDASLRRHSFGYGWMASYERIFGMRPRSERRLAMLRHVEALRLYAAGHQGQWPDSLEDIRDLPLPVDPFTGKAFTYRRENKTAVLEAPPPPGMTPSEANWLRYELKLRSMPAAQ